MRLASLRFARRRGWNSVRFPRTIFSSESVIVETFEPGESISDVLSLFKDGEAQTLVSEDLAAFIVTTGTGIYLKMLLLDNLMHADLHPGNIMINRGQEDGSR